MNLNDVVIVSTARTALTKSFRGSFNDTEAPVLGGHEVRAVVERAGIEPGLQVAGLVLADQGDAHVYSCFRGRDIRA